MNGRRDFVAGPLEAAAAAVGAAAETGWLSQLTTDARNRSRDRAAGG